MADLGERVPGRIGDAAGRSLGAAPDSYLHHQTVPGAKRLGRSDRQAAHRGGVGAGLLDIGRWRGDGRRDGVGGRRRRTGADRIGRGHRERVALTVGQAGDCGGRGRRCPGHRGRCLRHARQVGRDRVAGDHAPPIAGRRGPRHVRGAVAGGRADTCRRAWRRRRCRRHRVRRGGNGPVPDEFNGVTVKVYGVPLVRPVMVAVVGAGFPVTVTGVCAVVPMYGVTL